MCVGKGWKPWFIRGVCAVCPTIINPSLIPTPPFAICIGGSSTSDRTEGLLRELPNNRCEFLCTVRIMVSFFAPRGVLICELSDDIPNFYSLIF